MIAVIEIGGNQFTVKKGDIFESKKVDEKEGSKFSLEAMLLSDEDGKDTKIGAPFIDGSKIELKVLEQLKGDKVRVFKMKSKKRQMKNNGFRPHLTKLEVVSVS